MADSFGSRAEVALALRLSEREITNLVKRGRHADGTEFPSRVRGRHRDFPLDRCFEWYIQFKQEEALERAAPREPSNLIDAELRKAVADAEIAELRVAKLRGEVAPIDAHRKELRRVLGKVRGQIVAMPGAYASRVLNLPDMAAAVARLREVSAGLLRELQSAAAGAGEETSEEEDLVDDDVAAES
jgi:phage terminase Nu1 subunit (DNA packaging protein)